MHWERSVGGDETFWTGIVHGTFAAACDGVISQISMEHRRWQYTIESSWRRMGGAVAHLLLSGPILPRDSRYDLAR